MHQSDKKRHIFLTGFMGAGKSRIGKTLAEQFGYPFYDSDDLIELAAGKKIREIFEQDGERVFRSIESAEIKKLCRINDPAVISLGGGAVQSEENFKLVQKHGVSVYLASSPEAIMNRVKNSNKRPLLDVGEGEDFEQRLLEKIKELLDLRIPVYERSDIAVERDGLELEEIVALIYKKIQIYRKPE
ncbi:MAG: shikimate kinase [Calditrichaceae bacterium]